MEFVSGNVHVKDRSCDYVAIHPLRLPE